MNEIDPFCPIQRILEKRLLNVQIVNSATSIGQERILLRRRSVLEALKFLKTDPDTMLDTLVDISAIHHVSNDSCIFKNNTNESFFEVYYLLQSMRLKYRVRLSVIIPEVFPSIPTVTTLYANANWYERELWDMFGIFVEGHPDLRRILLYPGFVGYPLHKSFPLNEKHPISEKINE